MDFAAALPEPLRALLSFAAVLLIIVPLCIAFGGLLGALLARHRRYERAVAFGGTLAATAIAPFVLLGATHLPAAFVPLLLAGLGLPGLAYWWLDRWASRR
ncbi:MAG TPA: hypothetical protein PLX20_12700 [Rhodocyclaceae bacterium]|nr:hypothetical protein [Rhodocyclaceae bacterium]HMV53948.1 hypothetical protein [Rhodocyclaceae bacterium]HMZ84473.1 hypothetical protein [Rhodocyclaceae bacterium]HNA04027.1 hypothetical protein [Rhodocyclaceae bacterium]HNB79658.1 hypothetical protein [Rhodocyclaceae bacterium]